MDKCWFVLRQTTYTPESGLIKCGHLIPDLRHLDQVINVESGPPTYLRGNKPSITSRENFQWRRNTDSETSLEASASVPIPAAAGVVSAGGRLGMLFKSSVENYWDFDILETSMFNPTISYVTASLKDQAVQDYIQRVKMMNRWTMYMVSGVAVAKGGAKHTGTETTGRSAHGGPTVSAAGIAEASLDGGFKRDKTTVANFNTSSDFIWAIRLTRLHKGAFRDLFDIETFSKGATYGKDDEIDVRKELQDEGMGELNVVKLPKEDPELEEDVFVLPEDIQVGISY
ncbi:hypothetical protein AA313_de0200601 [Arthrobotrys entomopaga]|nr:hypothetical protein AA313_de0200601 [Arthrobotrys entomopaga]